MAKLVKKSVIEAYEAEARERKKKKKKKTPHHDIFLMDPEMICRHKHDLDNVICFDQVVNVYEHTKEDFERNAFKIIDHFKRNLGRSTGRIFTIGQYVKFRVVKGGPVFQLILFKFFHNYLLLEPQILAGLDLSNWTPWDPPQFSNSAWCNTFDDIIYLCRPYFSAEQMGEIIENIKYEINMAAVDVGDIIGLSISNNEIIECMKRSDKARKAIQCDAIDDDLEPNQLEKLVSKRTKDLLKFMSDQKDLSIGTLAGNGLFNPMQAREFFVHIGYKPTLTGATLPYTENTNALMGWKGILAHMSNAIGGRKAETLKLKVSDAGDFERSLSALLSGIKYADLNYNCDSRHFRKRYIDSQEVLKNLEGRVCTLDPKSDVFMIIDPYDVTQNLIGKTVYLKTPITCTHPRRNEGYICSACYGKLLSAINQNCNIGLLTALNCSDELEQKLLSAKHSLYTNTSEVSFSDNFNDYFENGYCNIRFNDAFIDAVLSDREGYENLYFEFNLNTIEKKKDGENRNFDRCVKEIVIVNANTEERDIVYENSGLPIFFSPEFNEEYFLPALRKATGDVVNVSISEIINDACANLQGSESFLLFEYQFKNHEIADSLMKLTGILFNGTKIDQYSSFNECMDELLPLFNKGGIHIPEVHIELVVSAIIKTEDMTPVDWNEEDPAYKFYSITKAILSGPSLVQSLLYRECQKQLAGRYGAYEKHGTSNSDIFLSDEG